MFETQTGSIVYQQKKINPTSIPWNGYILPDDQGTSWLVLEMIRRNGFGIGEQCCKQKFQDEAKNV